MAAILTTAMRVLAAGQLMNGLTSSQSNLYLFIGRTLPWTVDTNPPPPVNSVQDAGAALNQMMSAKRISPTDVSLVAPRYDWASGTVYTAYSNLIDLSDPKNTPTPFYVVNSSLSVYLCLGNANGQPSTVEPTSTSTGVVTAADGYQWKYLYTINSSDALAFVTADWIPVTTLKADDGSPQWQVQQATIPGTVDRVDVVASGSNYSQTPTVSITGDGTGAQATAVVTNGYLTAINVQSNGSGYTYANVSISGGGGSGASATAIVSPSKGHGADPQVDLCATNTMVKAKLTYGENGAFTVANDYRQIGIVSSPLLAGTTTTATALDYSQATSLTLTSISGTTFAADEVVTGASSGAMGYVLDWDSSTGILRIVQTQGTFTPGERVSGANASGSLQTLSGNVASATANTVTLPNTASATDNAYNGATLTITSGTGAGQTGTISSYSGLTYTATLATSFAVIPDTTSVFVISTITLPQLNPKSGDVLYLENRLPIPRASDQSEVVRIVIPN